MLAIFWVVFSFFIEVHAAWETDVALKITAKQTAISLDATVALSVAEENFELATTCKATHKKVSSLKVTAKQDFAEDIEGRFEILFDTKSLRSLKLKVSDLPFSKGSFDFETYCKYKESFTLYQVTAGFDDLTVAAIPVSVDLVLREAYLRAKLTLEDDDTLCVQGVWKKGAFDTGKIILAHDEASWSVKEELTYTPDLPLPRAKDGQLTITWEPSDLFSLKVVCEHTFCSNSILINRLTPTMKLEIGEFGLTWQGAYQPQGSALCLGTYTLTLSDTVQTGILTLKTALKIKDDRFYSCSVKLALNT